MFRLVYLSNIGISLGGLLVELGLTLVHGGLMQSQLVFRLFSILVLPLWVYVAGASEYPMV